MDAVHRLNGNGQSIFIDQKHNKVGLIFLRCLPDFFCNLFVSWQQARRFMSTRRVIVATFALYPAVSNTHVAVKVLEAGLYDDMVRINAAGMVTEVRCFPNIFHVLLFFCFYNLFQILVSGGSESYVGNVAVVLVTLLYSNLLRKSFSISRYNQTTK